MPMIVPRRMKSRRVILPAEYSSMMWFSIGLACRLMESSRLRTNGLFFGLIFNAPR